MSDLIFYDADILTMDDENPSAQAVRIQGNKIKEIGSNNKILGTKNDGTVIISTKGKTIIPGFIDSHIHIFPGSEFLSELNLMKIKDFETLKSSILSHIKGDKSKSTIHGRAAHYQLFKASNSPSRKQLDSIISDRPLLLVAPDGHTAWANTKALSDAKILEGATLPRGNEVVLTSDGLAEGMLKENEAMKLVTALEPPRRSRLGLDTGSEPTPKPTDEERETDKKILRKGLGHLAQLGITSVHNMDGNFYTLELLEEIQKENGLTCRVRVPFHFKPEMNFDKLDLAVAMHQRWNNSFLSSGFVKFFMDGVIGSGTAFLIDDYADTPGWKGEALFSEKKFKELAAEVDKRGLQIAVHSIGDGAVRRVLNGYTYAKEVNGTRDSRHRVEHIELIQKEDIRRLEKLSVIASMQPVHPPGNDGLPLEPELSKIGKNRFDEAYAWKSIKDTGAILTFSTDWPVSNVDPINCIFNALNRKKWTKETIDQRLNLIDTLKAYTKFGSYAEFKENEKGMLKEGYLADLVVLSDSIEKIDVSEIKNLHVKFTVMDGKIIFQRD